MLPMRPPLLGGFAHGAHPEAVGGVAPGVTSAPVVGWVELSGENPALARAELAGALGALDGKLRGRAGAGAPGAGYTEVELPEAPALRRLAERLALARRVLRAFPE